MSMNAFTETIHDFCVYVCEKQLSYLVNVSFQAQELSS